jgi:hypothetical protein
MLDPQEIERLVDMQHRSYRLLKWLADAVKRGFVSFDTAHEYSELPEAAEGWIAGHYLNIPETARPRRDDLQPFCTFFSTYLTNSFDLVADPGKQRYSPGAHCFCPMCSWLVDAPNLKTKRVQLVDKHRAQRMLENAVLSIVAEHGLDVTEKQIARLLIDDAVHEDASLVAYAHDLRQRTNGIANGPAVLVLWRGFAWNRSGSPKHGYRLKAESMIVAEKRLIEALQGVSEE